MYQLAEKPNPITPAFISNDLQVVTNHLLHEKKKHTHSVKNRQCCAKRLCYFAKKKFQSVCKIPLPMSFDLLQHLSKWMGSLKGKPISNTEELEQMGSTQPQA